MGMFVLTDGNFYIKNGNAKREYLATNKIEEALRVTRRQGNNILNKKSKIHWIGSYYLMSLAESKIIDENIEMEKRNNIHSDNYKGKAYIYTGDNKVEINEEIITNVNDIVSAINSVSIDKSVLDNYMDKLSSMLSYYDSVISDIRHIIKYKNPPETAKIKIYDIEHIIENKRAGVKQAFAQVQILLSGINNNWNIKAFQDRLSDASWKDYKGRTDYYDDLLDVCNADEQKNTVANIEQVNASKYRGCCKPKKKVVMFNLDGTYINEFESACEAARQTGVSRSSISSCCRGKSKQGGGYIWKFKTE